jgi:hypothetical protein
MKDTHRFVEVVNLPRGKKSFLHASNKQVRRNFDADKLDYIQKNIGLPSVREKTLSNPRYTQARHERTPDLIINNRIILEHDTVNIHGELGFENEKTLKRNIDHCLGDLPWCVINADLANNLGLDEAKLAKYLYYHTISHDNARKKALQLIETSELNTRCGDVKQ